MLNITIPTLCAGFIVSVHRIVMENHPADPDNIQGNRRPKSFMRTNIEHARTTFRENCEAVY